MGQPHPAHITLSLNQPMSVISLRLYKTAHLQPTERKLKLLGETRRTPGGTQLGNGSCLAVSLAEAHAARFLPQTSSRRAARVAGTSRPSESPVGQGYVTGYRIGEPRSEGVGRFHNLSAAGGKRPGRDHARKLAATSVCAHPDRSRMAGQLEPLPNVGDLGAVDLQDGDILVEVIADKQIFSIGRECCSFR
jgi:hypothetical protein